MVHTHFAPQNAGTRLRRQPSPRIDTESVGLTHISAHLDLTERIIGVLTRAESGVRSVDEVEDPVLAEELL